MSRDLDAVLSSIDGALADAEFPDAMRWSPEPETVDDAPEPFDGETVWQPPQQYEEVDRPYRWADGFVESYDRDHPLPPLAESYRQAMNARLHAARRRDEERAGWTDPATADPLGDLLRAAELYRGRPVGTVTRVVEDEQGLHVEGELNALGARVVRDLGLGDPFAHARARCSVLPVFDGILDELYLVDPAHRAEVELRRREEALRAFGQIGQVVQQIADLFAASAESIGKAFAAVFSVPSSPPPPSLRETDPRAYALQLRQSRGTGPDRQLQRQHRPRRHG